MPNKYIIFQLVNGLIRPLKAKDYKVRKNLSKNPVNIEKDHQYNLMFMNSEHDCDYFVRRDVY